MATFSDWLKGINVGQALPSRTVLQASFSENVLSLLLRLEANQMRCALVVDALSGVRGFVDAADVSAHILQTTQWGRKITEEQYGKLYWQGQRFFNDGTGLLVDGSKHDPYNWVSSFTSLYDAAQALARGVHRLAVVDNNTVNNILSQSDIISVILSRANFQGTKFEKTLSDVGLQPVGTASTVFSVNENAIAVDVLKLMFDKKISGVPVVDDTGRIVCNFSVTDLTHLKPSNFPSLSLNIIDFIKQLYGMIKPPVCIQRTDSVELLLYKFFVFKVHRVYVVDTSFKVNGVVTLTDVMQLLLKS